MKQESRWKIQEQHKSLPCIIRKIELEITMEEDSFVELDLKLRFTTWCYSRAGDPGLTLSPSL